MSDERPRGKKRTTVHLNAGADGFLASRGAKGHRGGGPRCLAQEVERDLLAFEAVLESTRINLDEGAKRAAMELIGDPWSWDLEDLQTMEGRFRLRDLSDVLGRHGLSRNSFLAAIGKLPLLQKLRLIDLRKVEIQEREQEGQKGA